MLALLISGIWAGLIPLLLLFVGLFQDQPAFLRQAIDTQSVTKRAPSGFWLRWICRVIGLQRRCRGRRATCQEAPSSGEQAQVGKHVPDSMSPQAMPNNVTDQVPETKNLLFVKLPDRILLIDPDNKLVTQIVTDDNSSITGSNTGGSSTNTSDRPSR